MTFDLYVSRTKLALVSTGKGNNFDKVIGWIRLCTTLKQAFLWQFGWVLQSSDCRRPSLTHSSYLYHTIDGSDSEQPAEEPAAKIRYSQLNRVQWQCMYYSCHPKRFEFSGKGKKKLFCRDGIFYWLNDMIIVLRLTTIVLSSRQYSHKFGDFSGLLIWWFSPSTKKWWNYYNICLMADCNLKA